MPNMTFYDLQRVNVGELSVLEAPDLQAALQAAKCIGANALGRLASPDTRDGTVRTSRNSRVTFDDLSRSRPGVSAALRRSRLRVAAQARKHLDDNALGRLIQPAIRPPSIRPKR